MRWRLIDRALGVFVSLIGAAVGAVLLPLFFFVSVFVKARILGVQSETPVLPAVGNSVFFLGVTALVAAAFAFPFALLMATAVHEALRRLRKRSIAAFVAAGFFLFGSATLVLAAAGTPLLNQAVFFPVTLPSVLIGSLLFARQMKRADARAGDPWP